MASNLSDIDIDLNALLVNRKTNKSPSHFEATLPQWRSLFLLGKVYMAIDFINKACKVYQAKILK
jgi:hypothetical protein